MLGITKEAVGQGKLKVDMWMQMVHKDIVRARAQEEQLVALRGVGRRVQEAMKATRIVGEIAVPDHEIALKAIRTTGLLHDKFQEKKGTEVNVGVQTNVGGNASGRSFEERVRLHRERAGFSNDPVVQHGSVIEAAESDDEFDEDDDES